MASGEGNSEIHIKQALPNNPYTSYSFCIWVLLGSIRFALSPTIFDTVLPHVHPAMKSHQIVPASACSNFNESCIDGKASGHHDETTASILLQTTPKASLLSLPPEIHLEIANRLIYPDALSLKHTSRHFYSLVDTGIELKIDWLVSRRKLHLECPNDKGCDLGSDLRFCRGSVAYVLLIPPAP